jgi:hypothetical protein
VVQEHVLDHLAAAHPRRHRLQQVIPAPQEPDARRTQHLVGAGHNPVHAEGLHIDGHVRYGLAGVQQHARADAARGRHNCWHVEHAAEHVRDVDERDELGAGRHQLLQVLRGWEGVGADRGRKGVKTLPLPPALSAAIM